MLKLKRLFWTLVSMVIFSALYAQILHQISFQGILADSSGPLTGVHTITFAIYDASEGGTPLWTETHEVDLGQSGVFSVILGSQNPLDLPFDRQYFIGISVDSKDELSPRRPMTSSPYAMNSENSSGGGVESF
ncbi:MAG: hypothetical protein DRQ10_04435 [Candidatus Hydrothermota bacterium]|nr:MAG: hypothetical protein DRQ10_04435 [Candidatus Hydrothermae bacterium]